SWRITAPLRFISSSLRRLVRSLLLRAGARPAAATVDFIRGRSGLRRAARRLSQRFPAASQGLQRLAGKARHAGADGQSPVLYFEPNSTSIIYKRLLEAGSTAARRQPVDAPSDKGRLRLAYVSPVPPARTGIADYSAELLPALARHY